MTTTLWYTIEEDADEFRDYVSLSLNASEKDVDRAITRVMKKLETDHLNYAVVRGDKTSYGCVSICRPIVEGGTPES